MKLVDGKNQKSKFNQVARIEALEKELTNVSMALRVNQALVKQLLEQLRPMQEDLTRFYGALNDNQYRLTAAVDLLSLDKKALSEKTDEFKLKDWQDASDKDDELRGLFTADLVESTEDIVVISSTTPDEEEDKGIFRSKTQLKDINNKEITEGFLNKSVGTTVETQINGSRHVVELLSIKRLPQDALKETQAN
jgi:hypothetical protein